MQPALSTTTTQPANPSFRSFRPLSKVARAASWAAQLTVAAILAQTLFFKFTYAPETQVIFSRLGGRPMATFVGLMELVCVLLLLLPRTAALGASLALCTIGGAIFLHLTVLGIQIIDPATGQGDGGLLFLLAVLVAAGSLVVLAIRWQELPWPMARSKHSAM